MWIIVCFGTFRSKLCNVPNSGSGGHNKKNHGLTLSCAKQLCMLSQTKKAATFRQYLLAVEELFKACILDRSNTLLNNIRTSVEIKQVLPMEMSLQNLKCINDHKNTMVVYVLKLLDHTDGGQYYKYGMTTDIQGRIDSHRRTFGRFEIAKVFSMANRTHIEVAGVEKAIRICIDAEIYAPIVSLKQTETFKLVTHDLDSILGVIQNYINGMQK